jgi:nucleolar protein 9
MPRGLRKRGRRHKKESEERNEVPQELDVLSEDFPQTNHDQATGSGPSWIISAASQSQDEGVNPDAPFGFVDQEVKAYFRTVDLQIRDWQDTPTEVEGEDENPGADSNEGMFSPLVASERSTETIWVCLVREEAVLCCSTF